MTKTHNIAARVQLHAARNFRTSDAWCIVLHHFTVEEIEERLLRTRCRDLDSAVWLFGELGASILARVKDAAYKIETIKEAA